MKNVRVLFAVPALLLGLAVFDGNTAEAGRFGLFRGRAIRSVPAYRVQNTTRTRSTVRSQSSYSNGPRIKGRHDWPGAIGNPDPRYQFFQDINGYWR